jgi:IMP dehydrogenase
MKEYRGMASADAQNAWRGYVGSEEGVATLVPYKGSVGNILKSLAKGIRSGFSYSGARTISEFQTKAQMIQQTSAGQFESSTHIYARS